MTAINVKLMPFKVVEVLAATDLMLEQSYNDYGQIFLVKVEESVINVAGQKPIKGTSYFRIFAGIHMSMIFVQHGRNRSIATTYLESDEFGVQVKSVSIKNEDMPTPLDDSRPRLVFECANSTFRFGGPDEVKTQVEVEKAVLSHKVSLVAHDMMTKIANSVLQETTEAQLHVQD